MHRFAGLICITILACACTSSRYYVQRTPLTPNLEIVSYHRWVHKAVGGIDPMPTIDEVAVHGERFRFRVEKYEIEGAVELDQDVLLLLRGNFGHFLAKLCASGDYELMGDFSDLPLETIYDFRVVKEDRVFVATLEYGCYSEGDPHGPCEHKTLTKRFRDALIFSGCQSVLEGE